MMQAPSRMLIFLLLSLFGLVWISCAWPEYGHPDAWWSLPAWLTITAAWITLCGIVTKFWRD